MDALKKGLNDTLDVVNGVIWHDIVLYVVLGVGVLFTIWSAFCQYRALTHGIAVTRGKYDKPGDPGAINHFQALSAALSATVGLGNIGGVATAIALGGPGAVFWMWVIGLAGMALKTTEVTLSMIYRNTDDPDNPHGGPMWVAKKGLEKMGFGAAGTVLGGIFCLTLLISAITGGNMFQAWNVAEVTSTATAGKVPGVGVGILLAVLVGLVIVGGIKRIGSVAGKLVPLMCAMYFLAAVVVLIGNAGAIPEAFGLIVKSAFSPLEAQNAFLGGTAGYAFLWGMKRALFSSEAGQGSSPIAHSAAKTDEPVREAVVAGLEPFIDTLVVCTLTALVILTTGAWNRSHEATFEAAPIFAQAVDDSGAAIDETWTIAPLAVSARSDDAKKAQGRGWALGDKVFIVARDEADTDTAGKTGDTLIRLSGRIGGTDEAMVIELNDYEGPAPPAIEGNEVYADYPGASLTTHAFNRSTPGLGTWLVLLASWLFAISTMISWSYYGEQGMIYLLGEKSVLPYKLVYCLLIIVATTPLIETDKELDNLTALGTGVMLWANIPIMLIFGATAMRAYHTYGRKLKAGEFPVHKAGSISDIVEGRDPE